MMVSLCNFQNVMVSLGVLDPSDNQAGYIRVEGCQCSFPAIMAMNSTDPSLF
jgi:hypothetical protein